ncbi:MAG TPA: SUMF1/EgtB/PvdO family nonheme iron enzyme, partial [Longimicrobiales bacterium]
PRPGRPGPVGSTFRNVYGIWDLHGLVWEWTAAAHSAMAQHAMHHGGATASHDMGCAGSAAGASDTRDYAAFLRYAFRAALTPGTSLGNLGFRCAL